MKRALLKRNQSGFTIIEVMIVLLIAGVILLMVFLAIPALQRNNRNTQRRNDVAALGGAVNEYSVNNNGILPANLAAFEDNVNLGFYDKASEVDYVYSATTPVTAEPGTNTSIVYVRNYMKCTSTNTVATSGASSRNVAAWFYVETSGDPVEQCKEL